MVRTIRLPLLATLILVLLAACGPATIPFHGGTSNGTDWSASRVEPGSQVQVTAPAGQQVVVTIVEFEAADAIEVGSATDVRWRVEVSVDGQPVDDDFTVVLTLPGGSQQTVGLSGSLAWTAPSAGSHQFVIAASFAGQAASATLTVVASDQGTNPGGGIDDGGDCKVDCGNDDGGNGGGPGDDCKVDCGNDDGGNGGGPGDDCKVDCGNDDGGNGGGPGDDCTVDCNGEGDEPGNGEPGNGDPSFSNDCAAFFGSESWYVVSRPSGAAELICQNKADQQGTVTKVLTNVDGVWMLLPPGQGGVGPN